MTKEERNEAVKQADKIRKNYIIGQCCSVDDLRCCLSNMNPQSLNNKRECLHDISVAIEYEEEHKKRVTIIKMLNAKWKSIQKTINK